MRLSWIGRHCLSGEHEHEHPEHLYPDRSQRTQNIEILWTMIWFRGFRFFFLIYRYTVDAAGDSTAVHRSSASVSKQPDVVALVAVICRHRPRMLVYLASLPIRAAFVVSTRFL
jgi:hypothetical protein